MKGNRTRAALDTAIVASPRPSAASPAQVAREFKGLLAAGAVLKPGGELKDDPLSLLELGYTPKHKLQLFGVTYFLTNLRRDDNFPFFVGYVRLEQARVIYPRIFYKDSSLVWRSATHLIRSDNENWIGKGAVKGHVVDGEEILSSAEETTDLPLEVQSGFDAISRSVVKPRRDERAIAYILRGAPDDRIEPYDDFSAPRRRAASNPRNLVHGGRDIAEFARGDDPTSLRFAKGFEPDFARGLLEESLSGSKLFGGPIRKFRILSRNRRIQYLFLAGPQHVWIIPPQALTTEIMSYGVRTIDVNCDERVCVPGFEFHFLDESVDPPELHSQIPAGYAGEQCTIDESRADAAPWLERLPVIAEFREKLGIRANLR